MKHTTAHQRPLYVTKPQLPPLVDFIPYLEAIWQTQVLTNGGRFHNELEAKLCEFLNVQHLSLLTNGTLGLLTALKALAIEGEVITTPYSFVATAHSLLWNGLRPVFVDIDERTFNIDPERIEAAITSRTSAILAVHVYGRPCAVDRIEQLACRHNIKVIYDAAHAFGVETTDGKSILAHGDLSVLSFHATKVFNTFEGGAIVSSNTAVKRTIDNLKNFGFLNETMVTTVGINGKMSEVSAAFGLLQLEGIQYALARRRALAQQYYLELADVRGLALQDPAFVESTNNSYFPVLVTDQCAKSRDDLHDLLRGRNILTRRYFHPLITEFPMYSAFPSATPANLPVATRIARQVLCLPIFPDMTDDDLSRVASSVRDICH